MAKGSTGFLTREEKEINWHRNFEDARMEINHFPDFGGWIVQGSHLSGSGETRDEAIDWLVDNPHLWPTVGNAKVGIYRKYKDGSPYLVHKESIQSLSRWLIEEIADREEPRPFSFPDISWGIPIKNWAVRLVYAALAPATIGLHLQTGIFPSAFLFVGAMFFIPFLVFVWIYWGHVAKENIFTKKEVIDTSGIFDMNKDVKPHF